MTNIRVKRNDNGTVSIFTPYHPSFVTKIKKIGGASWNGEDKSWNIPSTALDIARKAMKSVYGETDIPTPGEKKYTLRVTFLEESSETKGPYRLFGKELARALGRDSGAKVGEDVILESGDIGSGGSMKYWESVIEKGAVFRLTHVNETFYNHDMDGGNTYKVEILEDDPIDIECLLREREKLVSRIAEIDAIIPTNKGSV